MTMNIRKDRFADDFCCVPHECDGFESAMYATEIYEMTPRLIPAQRSALKNRKSPKSVLFQKRPEFAYLTPKHENIGQTGIMQESECITMVENPVDEKEANHPYKITAPNQSQNFLSLPGFPRLDLQRLSSWLRHLTKTAGQQVDEPLTGGQTDSMEVIMTIDSLRYASAHESSRKCRTSMKETYSSKIAWQSKAAKSVFRIDPEIVGRTKPT